MKKKFELPFDERLIPDIFSFKYPKSPWVRLMLFIEMVFAVVVVIGTLVMVLLPKPAATPANYSGSVTR
jgi:hypothetical protein